MIMENSRGQLICDAISFMQSVVGYYGDQKGIQVWETIADACDPDIKGEIFIKMLTGEYSGRINVTGVKNDANAVACIKAIRTIDSRGPGLKEAKDLYDACRYNNKPFNIEVNAKNRGTAARELRTAGFIL